MNRHSARLAVIGLLALAFELLALPCYAVPQEGGNTPGNNSAVASAPAGTQETSAEDKEKQAGKDDETDLRGDGVKDSDDYDNDIGASFLRHLMTDQRDIWTSPFRLRPADTDWLLPLGGAIGGFFATDRSTARAITNNPTTLNHYRTFSNYGIYSLVGVGGGLYVWGKITHDDHKRETGVLVAEAVINSLAVNSALSYPLGRERPYVDDGRGLFFKGGTSFPSDHSVIAWSAASVIAHEYPGTLTDILAYGMATAVSASRVMGKEHFPSDVVVGSAIGWMVGREIYKKHHDPDLGGGGWDDLSGGTETERHRDHRSMGSPFVPLDSWIYPALDRLAGLGYISTSIEGVKPWTRIECARLIEEASEALQENQSAINEATALVARLQLEFGYETNLLSGGRNLTANIDSLYTRAVSISGPDLNDSYHFGQTIAYDFGRPYERGTNLQDGGYFSFADGPVTVFVRAEFQHAPSAPAFSQDVRDFIGAKDEVPVPPDTPIAAVNRAELLDTYVAWDWNNFEVVAGKQSLSWGPGPGGSLIWSDNIVPVNMVRITNPEPFHLPGILKYLGPVRTDQFFGRLGGHDFIARPFIYGQKITFKPLPRFEIGFARTTEIGGTGATDPLTLGNLVRSEFGLRNSQSSVPGSSSTSMDWTFYVPKVGNYLVFYGELYNKDDGTPLENPPQSAYRPGIYITHFPKLPKLDLHLEVASTETYPWKISYNEGEFNYYNSEYRDGYTNYGNLIGNTVGRMGQAYQGWLTYWISPRNTLQLTYKNSRVDSAFVPGGGAWQDYGLANEIHLKSGFYLKTQVQYENISHYPILFTGPQRNVSAIVEAGFMPGRPDSGSRRAN